MVFIIAFLSFITMGSMIWTIIQILKPEWFFKAENEANLKRQRPKWYLIAGIAGLVSIIIIWGQAFQLGLTSVWILTGILTFTSLKPLGMVFFYEKFSGEVSELVVKMNQSKKAYWTVVSLRGVLSLVLLFTTLYFIGVFKEIV